ncbi:MAG: hypothetical protein ACE15F_21860 [bacterium]
MRRKRLLARLDGRPALRNLGLGMCMVLLLDPAVWGGGSQGMVFLIQSKWGGIAGISLNANQEASTPVAVRPNPENVAYPIIDLEVVPGGGYQLTANGRVLPLGDAKMPYTSWGSIRGARGLAIAPEVPGGWIAAANYIKKIGSPPPLVFPSFDQGSPIADLEYDLRRQQLAVIHENGALSLCGRREYTAFQPIQLENDTAIDLETAPPGFYVLTRKGKVYEVTQNQAVLIHDDPDLGEGLVCDLEVPPDGHGFYLLDVFGVIHAFGGAPPVLTSEPLAPLEAVDLEIIPGDVIPRWDPPGLHTRVSFHPEVILLDPEGPRKPISIDIQNAEQLTGFYAQLEYDPGAVTLEPGLGSWWERSMRGAPIDISVDPQGGSFSLRGGGAFFPYEGVNGGGELVKLMASPVKGVTAAVTVLKLTEFYFRDASLESVDRPAQVVNSCTVVITPVQPQLDLAWSIDEATRTIEERTVKPGEVIRADIVVENGSRIRSFEFGFRFPNVFLKFLGMTPGAAWRDDARVLPRFDLPSLANRQGGLERQWIEAEQAGACQDQADAIVSLFFAVTSYGEGDICLTEFSGLDDADRSLDITAGNRSLRVVCQ